MFDVDQPVEQLRQQLIEIVRMLRTLESPLDKQQRMTRVLGWSQMPITSLVAKSLESEDGLVLGDLELSKKVDALKDVTLKEIVVRLKKGLSARSIRLWEAATDRLNVSHVNWEMIADEFEMPNGTRPTANAIRKEWDRL